MLAVCGASLWPSVATGQEIPFDPVKTIIPLRKIKIGMGGGLGVGIGPTFQFGTGFCLNLNCRFVGTNYHVTVEMGASPKIKGEEVTKRYWAASSHDEGATWNYPMDTFGKPKKYNLSHDFAIYELKHPLASKGMRGVAFSFDDLEENQDVDIYAYPLTNRLVPTRKLVKFRGKFAGETREGVLAFRYERSTGGQSIRPGASGGLIIDRGTQKAVGVLLGVATDTNIVAAVSVQSLADFVKSVNPALYAELFPGEVREDVTSADSLRDIYPRYIPTADPTPAIQYRQDEPAEIKRLREKAQDLADGIREFIAVQTVEYGGMRSVPAPSQYEVRVIDGRQQFRKYPDGEAELPQMPLPLPDPIMGPGGEWSALPTLVGTALKLKMVEAPDAIIAGRRVKIFRYHGDLEDAVCGFRNIIDYVFFEREKEYSVSCDGEVWADEDFNIIRISENDDLPSTTKWSNFRAVVTYGWLDKPEVSHRLIPVTFTIRAEFRGKVYWCRGRFTNYRVFSVKAKLLGQ